MSSRSRLWIVLSSACLVALLLAGAHIGRSASPDAYRHMAVFTEVLSHIKSDYVEEPDLKSVTLGALNGLLEAIDPFASYLNADQYKQYLRDREALKGDVGLVLSKRSGYVDVVAALANSPAAKVGISTGDVIESISGVATRDMPLAYAEILLRGQPGSEVEVSLLRLPDPEPQKIKLTREVLQLPGLSYRMLPDNIGYIRPETLLSGRASEIASAIRSLEKQGASGFILDLRNCALGTAEEGLAVANLFLERGLMTYFQGQQTPRKEFLADPSKLVTRLPVVVAANHGTADGAEIAAMALLENKRAEVVGERTFGDAALRRAITLDDGGAIILSVAKYYSPQGKAVQDTGVVPTVAHLESEPVSEIEETEGAPQQIAPKPPVKPEDDGLLKKAIEVLTKGPAAAPGAQAADAATRRQTQPAADKTAPLDATRK